MTFFVYICSMIISCLIDIYLIFNFQDEIYNHDIQFLKHKKIFALCFTIIFTVNLVGNPLLNIFAIIMITYCISVFIGRYITKRIVILNALFIFMVMIIEEITYALVSILLGHDLINMKLIVLKNLILIIISKTFIIILYKLFVERIMNKNYNYLKSTHIQLMVATFLLLFICIISISMVAKEYPTFISVLSSLSVFIIFLIVLHIIRKLEINVELSREVLVKDTLINQMQKNYDTLFEKYKDDRKLIHDFKNHLNILKILQKESPNNMTNYLEGLDNYLNKTSSIVIEDNSIIPTILSKYIKKCKDMNIEFIINCPSVESYSITSIDWVIILSNLLDNAIENINPNNPIIQLSIKKNAYYLVLSISNTCSNIPKIQNNSILTTKKDKFDHGYGIENIKFTVKKYHGDYQLLVNQNDMFEFNIVIPLSYKQ